jgi:integrase
MTSAPTERDLIFFAVAEARRGISPGAIKSSLSAIVSGTVASGFKNPVRGPDGMPLPTLRRVIRGISRTLTKARRTRKPLTVDKLAAVIAHAVNVTGSTYDAAAMRAALCTGTYLMLRIGEMVSPSSTTHEPTRNLNVEDVAFFPSFENPEWMVLNIKVAKADPFRNGSELKVFTNGTATCPVKAMQTWLRYRGRTNGKDALFRMNNGKFLTRTVLQRWMRSGLTLAGYEGEQYSCHSLRAGGAESLAAAGYDASILQVLGRWASASFLLYLQVSDSVKKGISKDLGRLQQQDIAAAHQRVGDPAADVWLA